MDRELREPMDRRSFLSGALALGAVGASNHLGRLRPAVKTPPTTAPAGAAPVGNRTLVLVTLYGGNDGLNTVVPYADPAYYRQRGAIAVTPSAALPLGQGLGLHPALKGINALWSAGQVAILRGVGYPDPNYRHFSSMDIWQSADPSADDTTGWIGRWLDGSGVDALGALWLGSNVPLAFVGKRQQASAIIASASPNSQVPPGDALFRSLYGNLQHDQRGRDEIEREIGRGGTTMLNVSSTVSQALLRVPAPTKVLPPSSGPLGTQLSIVSQLIAAELPTKVYGVSLGGFDSHAGEEASYAPLFAQLDSAVSGFFASLASNPQAGNTVMMIYSEFGRRVAANASGGSDHGAANDVFVIGPPVKGGFYGDQPSLTALDATGSLIPTQDFRSIYATLLDQVIDVEPKAVLKSSWPEVPFI